MNDTGADSAGDASEPPPEPLADHVNAGLSVGSALFLLGTGLTDSLVLALLTIALMAPLTALATYTAVASPTASTWRKATAAAAAIALTALFVLGVETLWGLVLPTAAMAAGIPRARSRRPRGIAVAVLLTALAVSAFLTLG